MNYKKIMMVLLTAVIVLSLFLIGTILFYFTQSSVAKKDYTWNEYNVLTEEQQEEFRNSFKSLEDFYAWAEKAQFDEMNLPWENEGKRPEDYTWEEFESLSAEEQEAFFEWFDSAEDFEKWKEEAEYQNIVEDVPWNEETAKKPEEYTWEEFESLSGEEQEVFYDYFESTEDFEEWQNKAQNEITLEEIPWNDDGTKKPEEYTWKEFEALTPEEQEVFFDYFDSPEEFENWKYKAKSSSVYESAPWNAEGSKKPDKYTKAEFEALTPEEQEMFFEWFDSAEKFEEWMKNAG